MSLSWIGLLVGLILSCAAPSESDAHLERVRRAWHGGKADSWLQEVAWMVEHEPESRLFHEEYTLWVIPPGDESVRARLATIWLKQVERDPASATIDNAYRAVVQSDFPKAESLLKRARQLYPADPRWTALLAGLYVSAVDPAWCHAQMARPEVVTPEIARRVKRELEVSKDVALLLSIGETASAWQNPLLRQVFGPPLMHFLRSSHPRGQPQRPAGPVRVGPPIANRDYLLQKADPVYPAAALKDHVLGPVTVAALVRIDGSVEELQVKSGHPLLVPAVRQAIRQWRYKPLLLNGEPVSVITDITVRFDLLH